MSKYFFALNHAWPSFAGFVRFSFKNPGFALTLLRHRWFYFRRRKLDGTITTPDGFLLDTPDALVAYWTQFVEGELLNPRWVSPLEKAEKPLVVDVGANAGLFSYLLFTLNPQAEIIAFEPLPVLNQKLKNLPPSMGIKLTVHPKAVGREVGRATMESPHGYDGISHITTSANPQGQTFQVEMTTLDQELPDRDVLLIKMDVEDYECEVIAGASKVLKRTKFVITEARSPQFLNNITEAMGPDWDRYQLSPIDYLFCKRRVN